MIKRIGMTVIAVLACALAAQSQTQIPYGSSICVKVKDGKAAEYAAFLRDVQGPLFRAQVTTGEIVAFTIGQAVIPMGTSARCDYAFALGASSFPGETNRGSDAALKLSGVKLTREAIGARQNELRVIVGKEIWHRQDAIGSVKIGDYVRTRYNKIKPGMMTDWVNLESAGWKGIVAAALKTTPGLTWRIRTLSMPGGSSLPYNAATIDVFPSWAALGTGIPGRALWKQVHPEQDYTAYFDKVNAMTDVTMIEVMKVIDAN